MQNGGSEEDIHRFHRLHRFGVRSFIRRFRRFTQIRLDLPGTPEGIFRNRCNLWRRRTRSSIHGFHRLHRWFGFGQCRSQRPETRMQNGGSEEDIHRSHRFSSLTWGWSLGFPTMLGGEFPFQARSLGSSSPVTRSRADLRLIFVSPHM